MRIITLSLLDMSLLFYILLYIIKHTHDLCFHVCIVSSLIIKDITKNIDKISSAV